MKRFTLCTLLMVIAVFLQGCVALRANLSSRDIATTPLPIISAASAERGVYVFINAVDKKPLDGVWYVNVDQGLHEVEYDCSGAQGKIRSSGRVSIRVEPGMSYYLQGQTLTNTKTYRSTEVVRMETNVVRDDSGRLIQSFEPVYMNFDRTESNVVGCTAKVLECKGYQYIKKNQGVMCVSEPIGNLRRFFIDKDLSALF